jgi:transcriptional regulator with XRE-family HTH domain
MADFLAAARESKGASRKDVAEAIGVSVDAVRRWENGDRRPKLEALESWADFLGYDVLVSFNSQESRLSNEHLSALASIMTVLEGVTANQAATIASVAIAIAEQSKG